MCIDFDETRYVIVLKHPKRNKIEIVSEGEDGYAELVNYFRLEDTYSSIEDADEYIQTMVDFNMWIPGWGLTLDNLKIQKVTINFEDAIDIMEV